MAPSRTVPLFVLPMGIFPLTQEPLRVFEPRYKQMLDDCVLEESPFGYVATVNPPEGLEVGRYLPSTGFYASLITWKSRAATCSSRRRGRLDSESWMFFLLPCLRGTSARYSPPWTSS